MVLESEFCGGLKPSWVAGSEPAKYSTMDLNGEPVVGGLTDIEPGICKYSLLLMLTGVQQDTSMALLSMSMTEAV